MENGMGAVHGPNDSGGSEIFEEAVESALDNENVGLTPDSDDVDVRSIAIGESDADFAAAEGSPRPLDKVEKTEIAVEGSSEGRDDNGAGVEKTEIPVEGSSEGRDDNDVSSVEKTEIAVEGSSEKRDGNGESSVDKTEIALEGSSEGRDDNGESVETRDESLVGNSGEGSVTIENNDDGVTNEELSNVDERVLSQDVAVTKESQSEESEASPLNVKEIEAIEGDEDTVEKSVVLEISESKDVGTIDQDGAHANLAEDVKDVITNGDVEHVNEEMVRELKDASADKSSESQKEKPEEIKETLSENLVHEDSEAVLSRNSPDIKESVEVVPDKVLVETDSQIHDRNKDSETRVLPPEHHDEGPKAEGRSSDDSLIASLLQDAKTESVASDLGAPTNGTIQMQSPDTVARDSQALAAGAATEKTKTEERQNSQAKETTVKPVETSAAASVKSANSVPPAHPAGLGRAAPLLEPAPRAVHQPRANGQVSQAQTNIVDDTTNGEVEEGDEIREKLQMIRVKFLRLAHRLGQTPHNVVVAQVLYRLGLAEQLRARTGGRVGAFSFDRASAMAEQLEAAGQEPLDFTCTIMVLGKAGVGKSATINSIFDEVKFGTDAFQMGTTKVQDVVGTVQGIKVRVIDTPGLLSSCSDQHKNEKILHSVKQFIKKSPPDIVLYLDRLDMPSRDFGDMPLLRTITDIFGPSIWFNAIVVLTHAASAPPEGPNGTPTTYDMFVTQRSHAVQQVIRQAAGDMRLMNPVALVENHSACRTNRAGQRVLPNGQVWKPHLLLLSFASKILAEANILLKLQDTPPGKPFTTRSRAPPLPYLLSTLLQSRPQLKLPEEQFGDDDAMDDDLCESSESDEESEYDELPPFKPLTKAQLDKLPKAQKKAYYDELEYREKLFMKKQLKEDRRRRKMMKKMAAAAKDMPSDYSENVEEESGAAASLPVPMPDLALPASFDSDNPTHRYRYLDTSNQWLVRPVLDNHGWDHDVGYEGINLERMFVVKDKVPLSFSGQVSKDKKEANLQMEVASSIKHGEGKATTLGFDMQSAGKDLVYTLRSETRFCNYVRNKATAGLSATLMGDVVSAGVKLEDKLIINKQLRMVLSGGAMAGRGDVAYGGSLEATFRDRDYPVGRFLSTLGLSVMDWHGELALGCNINTQIPLGRSTNLIARANLNNRGSGQVSLRLNSAEQLQLALIGFLPLLRKLMGQGQDLGY
ncbi:translocase of chloroplast 120, chloroplastic-like [Chenopodium quinoa]|uniref:AIG1-type G domain-containing protein n=1 Tax=Chenopodium quinoa TaxID=63459 RepID=A0A803LGH0_CHEQI|nr:translocase of chloroplast 120, chloroplastic-like [Chenopodium quinoa]